MTVRERVVAAARGGEVDQRPVFSWPTPGGDLGINGEISLREIHGPFSLALSEGRNLNDVLREDPASNLLEDYVQRVRINIEEAFSEGVDGIIYILRGAEPSLSSPMQYGGHFLEHDRALLEEVKEARLNVLVIAGGEGAFLDFVSDLAAHVFAWDVAATGFSVEDVRRLRSGALATSEPSTEFYWPAESSRKLSTMEKVALGTV